MEFFGDIQSNITIETLLAALFRLVFFVIGFIINIKMVFVCWKSRKNCKTWQLHICYCTSCTILFAFVIPFSIISHTIPHLSRYTGEVICYLSSFTILFNTWIIHINSLMVAIAKYIFIVHWNNALLFGHDKIQWIVLGISLLIPAYIAVISTCLKDVGVIHILSSCFGPENRAKNDFLCHFDEDEFGYIAKVVLQILCLSKFIISLVISTNICEAFFYYKTFKRMKRWVIHSICQYVVTILHLQSFINISTKLCLFLF